MKSSENWRRKSYIYNTYFQISIINTVILTSMIILRIFLKRIVSASDFFFRRLWPFWAPFRRPFINVKALGNNEIKPILVNISMRKTLRTLAWWFALHSWGENIQSVLSSARHFEKIVEILTLSLSSSNLSIISLVTRPVLADRPRLPSVISQKEEFPDLLSLSAYATSPAILKAVLMPENDTFF